MVRAGALLYVIGLSFVIFLILSSLTIADGYSRLALERSFEMERLQRNCISGINYLLSDDNACQLNNKQELDLFGEGRDSVTLERKTWGLFEYISSTSHSTHGTWTKTAIAGNLLPGNTAIYLADLDRPLSICGKTEITGTAALPKSGIKRAYIEGKNYTGKELVYGTVMQSERFLPPVDDSLFSSVLDLLESGPPGFDSLVRLDMESFPDSMKRKFSQPEVYFFSNDPLQILNVSLKGKILIFSTQSVFIHPSAQLNDVIILSKKIVFGSGFRGSLQAIASDTIIVEKDCKLEYPSVLCVVRGESKTVGSLIKVAENSEVSGALLAWEEEYNPLSQVKIQIEKKCLIRGLVFSNGSVDHRGDLYGCLITNMITLKTPSSYYDNHLLDAKINAREVNPKLLVPPVLKGNKPKSVLKWLSS